MTQETHCPKCRSENIYQDGLLWICPECATEWNPTVVATSEAPEIHDTSVKDANGNILSDGDSVTVVKELKVKGSSSVVKVGTKVKNIRLIEDSGDGHDIACKIDGFGSMNLKSSVVKKSN